MLWYRHSLRTKSIILGTGSYIPEKKLSNEDLEQMVDTNHAWITERTGISIRHIAGENEMASDMALRASQIALDRAGLQPADIDAIIFATMTPDDPMPSAACLLQNKLGCRSVMAFDVSAACSGFIYALQVGQALLQTRTYSKVLVVGSEALSQVTDYNDRETCILFGDGAGAVILGTGSQFLSFHLGSDGSAKDLLFMRHSPRVIQMRGRETFRLAVRSMVEACELAMQKAGLTIEQIDWLIPHQANIRIIESVGASLKIPSEKVIVNIQQTGNTSSASIPIALDESIQNGRIQRGQVVLVAAFGGGLTFGASIFKY